jgi:hypothetical protein
MRWLRLIIMAVLFGTMTAPLSAQHECQCGLREVKESDNNPNRRSGIWASLGAGAGVESFNAYDGLGWTNGIWGGVVSGKAGLTVGQNLTIGGEGQLWIHEFPQYRRMLGSIMIIGQLYPVARGGFFLKGGAGWTRDDLRLYYSPPTPIQTERNGWGFVAGIGYDVRIGKDVSITPSVDFVDHYYDIQEERMLNMGLAITFH